jgi:excisionase family DNA binding protein
MEQLAELGPVLTVQETADALRVDRTVIYNEIAVGNITAIRVGRGRGSLRIPVSEFRAYVSGRRTSAGESPALTGEAA